MQRLIIEGGEILSGEMRVQGAKNSVLPLMSAALLAEGETVFYNSPILSDVYAAGRIINSLGGECIISSAEHTVRVNPQGISRFEIPEELMNKMRSSVVFLGAILGKYGECRLTYPGGCEIGLRPIDIHLSSLRKMGAVIREERGILDCRAGRLCGAAISLPFPSVGATENIILAAATAEGETIIKNAAREPEIADMANYLNRCGAKIRGAGESTVVIEGVKKLSAADYTVMPDRIAAATYLSAAAATGGEIILHGADGVHTDAVLQVLEQSGCKIYPRRDGIALTAPKRLRGVKTIRTQSYPGFPTDAQAIVMAALSSAEGTTVITENIFESRYRHVEGLLRMGADIKIEGKVAVIDGVKRLHGAAVNSPDLRGGAALVIAALSAEGESEVGGLCCIDRGYEKIEKAIGALGGKIRREQL